MIFRPEAPGLVVQGAQISAIPSSEFSAEATALFAAMSVQPDATRKLLIDATINDLKDAGIWSELDELWLFAAHTEQAALLGWKRYKDATNVGSMPFSAGNGFQRDTGTKYIQTNFNPSTDGVKYTQNDASFGVFIQTSASDSSVDIGCIQTTVIQILANNGGNANMAINITSGSLATAVASSIGMIVGRRTASNAQQIFKDGVSIDSNSSTSTSLPNRTITVGARNNAGTIDAFSVRRYGFAFVGASLSSGQQSDFYNIISNYIAGALYTSPMTFNASDTWVAPLGVTSITVQAWGGGGNGSAGPTDGPSLSHGGGGGGGGAYASSVVAVTPEQSYTVTVGGAGGNSQFIGDDLTVLAAGGANGFANSVVGGTGGTVAASTGTTRFAGGNGGNSTATTDSGGGGGGGSAGISGNGNTGSDNSTATGGTGGGGGAGGGGGGGGRGGNATSNSGLAGGSAPGGGGGGAGGSNNAVGSGAAGRIIISW